MERAQGIAFCLFLSHSLRVLRRNETCRGLVEEESSSQTFYFHPSLLLLPCRWVSNLAVTAARLSYSSSRGLIAINRGLVGFGFVAIASDIHACTQRRCLTGAHACKRGFCGSEPL